MNINKKLNLRFLSVNTEFTNVTGYTQKDVNTLNGRQAFNFIHPIDRPNFIRKLLQAYYKDFENSPTLIFRFQKQNGKYIRIKILINGITQKDGSHILFTTFIEQNG